MKGRFLWNKAQPVSREVSRVFQPGNRKRSELCSRYEDLLIRGFRGGTACGAKDAYEKARSAASTALEKDERLAEGHAILAAIKTTYDWDWEGAEREFKLAIQLNPNYATAHQRYSLFLPIKGRFEEAISEARQARDLDPLSLAINENVGDILYLARRYDPAIEQLRKTLELDPNYSVAHSTLAKVYDAQGKHEEALDERVKTYSPETAKELKEIFASWD